MTLTHRHRCQSCPGLSIVAEYVIDRVEGKPAVPHIETMRFEPGPEQDIHDLLEQWGCLEEVRAKLENEISPSL